MKRLALVAVMIVSFPSSFLAGTTGKIAGRVADLETGQPLSRANIVVEGTPWGAMADDRGYFNILNVPVGTYHLKATMMGYSPQRKAEVTVNADLTTRVDFFLAEKVLEVVPPLRVMAERPLIKRDITYTAEILRGEELRELPGVVKLEEVLALQPNIVKDVELKEVHLRGGRGGEVLYLVDGLPVNDKFVGGRLGMEIPMSEVEEVEIITGGFSADYGEAQSGVVNLVTREGDGAPSVEILYKTDDYGYSYPGATNYDYSSLVLSGPEPITTSILPFAGFHLPGRLTYFLSGYGEFTDTYLYMGESYPAHTRFGTTFRDRQENRYGGTGKLRYQITPTRSLSFAYRRGVERYSLYEPLFIEIPSHAFRYLQEGEHLSLNWNHSFSPTSFYTLKLGKFATRFHFDPRKTPPELAQLEARYKAAEDSLRHGYDVTLPEDRGKPADIDDDGLFEMGYDTTWHDHRTSIYSATGAIVSQLHSQHELKAGVEATYYDLEKAEIEHIYYYDPDRVDEPGPWPGYGWERGRDIYRVYPSSGSFYLRDKVETEGLVFNGGIRYDYFIPGEQVETSSEVKGYLSPRLGFSYPVTDKDAVFASYGHFYQMPELQYVYLTEQYKGFDRLIGNPDLEPEVTKAYEVRLEHVLEENLLLKVSAYKKDIRSLVDAERMGEYPLHYYQLTNSAYGDVTGMEIELEKPYGKYLTGRLTYNLSEAKGKTSKDKESFYEWELERALQSYPLLWDQRHQIYLNLRLKVEDEPLSISGVRSPAHWGMSLLWRYGSGLPYSPTPEELTQYKRPLVKTFGRMPSTSSFDLKLDKSFLLSGTKLSIFTEVENLFDNRNVAEVNRLTGETTLFGPERRFIGGIKVAL